MLSARSIVPAPVGPPQPPLNPRGVWPVFFSTDIDGPRLRGILQIPGVIQVQGGLRCTWDVAWVVARLIGQPEPQLPTWDGPFSGLARYRALGLHEKTRPYQKEDILFLARRGFAILGEPMRTGKTLMVLGADVLVDSRRTLIVAPSIAKWVWAEEILKWTGERALILEGRGVREARLACNVCGGRGMLSAGEQCMACVLRNGQSLGYDLYDVPKLQPASYRDGRTGEIYWNAFGTFTCPQHPEVVTREAHYICGLCRKALLDALQDARYVVANYEVLSPQHVYDGAGGDKGVRDDLAGWASVLDRVGFDVAVFDEGHLLRGWTTASVRQGERRRDMAKIAVRRVPRVWIVTGTPFFGFTRDVWGPLDVASDGLFDTRGFKFMARYCLPSEAPVWMSDLTSRPISSVKKGDLVWGWEEPNQKHARRRFRLARVLATFTRISEVVEVTLASGRKVRCTPDHLWANARGGASADHRPYVPAVLGGVAQHVDGRLRGRTYATKLGFVTPMLTGAPMTKEYKRGYLHGIVDGDGCASFRWHLRPNGFCPSAELRRSVDLRVKDTEAIDRVCDFARTFRLTVTRQGPNQAGLWTAHLGGKRALRFFYASRTGSDDYWRGFLGGVYDAEAWGGTFAQYRSVNPETYDNICDALTRFGFAFRTSDEAITLRGGRDEFVRLWCLIRPAIQRKAVSFARSQGRKGSPSNWAADEVVSIRSVGQQRVYCLKTETGNFVAYGYATKNCEGQKGLHGYKANGRSAFAETELVRRLEGTRGPEGKLNLDGIMIKRAREELFKDLPVTQRQVVRLEIEGVRPFIPGQRTRKGALVDAMRQVHALKRAAILDSLMDEMAEGNKILIFCFHVPSAIETFRVLEKAIASPAYRTRMRQVNAKAWLATGAARHEDGTLEADETVLDDASVANLDSWARSPKARFELARTYREHQGAGVIVATIDAMQVAISLRGASTVHFLDLHWSPGAIAQAEERPWMPDIRGVSIMYYVAKGSVDDHVEAEVLPKVETLARLARERGAQAMLTAFSREEEERTFDGIWARLTRHLQGAGLDATTGQEG